MNPSKDEVANHVAICRKIIDSFENSGAEYGDGSMCIGAIGKTSTGIATEISCVMTDVQLAASARAILYPLIQARLGQPEASLLKFAYNVIGMVFDLGEVETIPKVKQ